MSEVDLHKPAVIGIVNISGDSFSEGSASGADSGAARARNLLTEGAAIVEFGAESTRPGAADIGLEAELARLVPVVREFRAQCPTARFGVDTRRAGCARWALEQGAEYISDVSMGRFDADMGKTLADFPAAKLVLCHSRGTPENMREARFRDYGGDVISGIRAEWLAAAEKLVQMGMKRENLIFDPGFGFAKSVEQQVEMLQKIAEFRDLGKIYVGVSRKSFLGELVSEPDPARRQGATLSAELILAEQGVDYIRTHEPKLFADAWKVLREVKKL